jgi:hypothetical protein
MKRYFFTYLHGITINYYLTVSVEIESVTCSVDWFLFFLFQGAVVLEKISTVK